MSRSTRMFCTVIVGSLLVGSGLGAHASGRLESGPAAVPPIHAPVLPVQMPANTGSFAKVAEAIKPAVILQAVLRQGARASSPAQPGFGRHLGCERHRPHQRPRGGER